MIPESKSWTVNLVTFGEVILLGLVMLTGCEFPCGPGGGSAPPFGLAICNQGEQQLTSASLALEPGGEFHFGPIADGEEVFRFIEVQGRRKATLNVTWASGRVQTLSFVLEVSTLAPVDVVVPEPEEIDWCIENPDPEFCSPVRIRESTTRGNARGVTTYYVANDTPRPIQVAMDFAEGANSWDWAEEKLDPYGVEIWGNYSGMPVLRGRHRGTIRLTYEDGSQYDVNVTLDLKPKQRLVFVIKEEGEVIVWDDPTVDDTSVVESLEITPPQADASN